MNSTEAGYEIRPLFYDLISSFIFGCAGSSFTSVQAFLSFCRDGAYSLAVVCGLLTVAASLAVEHRLDVMWVSALAVQELSFSEARRISPDHGSNLSPALAGGLFTSEPPGKPCLYFK